MRQTIVVHDEGSEVCVDEEPPDPEDSSNWSSFDRVGWCRSHEFVRRTVTVKFGPSFLEGAVS